MMSYGGRYINHATKHFVDLWLHDHKIMVRYPLMVSFYVWAMVGQAFQSSFNLSILVEMRELCSTLFLSQ